MGKVVADITMSLDGYVTGPEPGDGQGLGIGGEALHDWVMGGPWTYDESPPFATEGVDAEVLSEALASLGAQVVGRRMFEHAGRWGGTSPFDVPTYVVSHRPAPDGLAEDSGFVFVDDVESAVSQAKRAAGDKNVGVGGGASTIQQTLRAGLADELVLRLAPVLLGGGTPLFDLHDGPPVRLRHCRSVQSTHATHLWYEIAG